MNRPNYIIDIPAAEYHQATKDNLYLTSHRLAVFRKCPEEYRQRVLGIIPDKDTASFLFGRAVHVFVLEGKDAFDAEFVVSDGPINEKTGEAYGKTTKAYKEWASAQILPVISSEDFKMMESIRTAVLAHPVAKDLLADGFAEGTIRTKWDGEPVQTRMDWFNPETGDLVDLKTCGDIDKFRFDFRNFGYAFQLAFYEKVLKLAGYEGDVRCWIVAVEKQDPFRVAVLQVSASTIGDCNEGNMGGENWRNDNDAMISELKMCRKDNFWPTRYEGVIVV